MNTKHASYQRHRFPSEIISRAVWLYDGCCLSFRDVEELHAKRDSAAPLDSKNLRREEITTLRASLVLISWR